VILFPPCLEFDRVARMPINGTSPVAIKAVSVASKKLCLSPVAWPSNGSLAATSLYHNWSPYLHSMTWKSDAHDERPQCRASRQYSALASLLDVLPPSIPESSQQAGINRRQDVDIETDRSVAGCAKSVLANGQEMRDEMRSSDTQSLQDIATPHAERACSSKSTDNGCMTDSFKASNIRYSVHDASVQSTEVDGAKVKERLGSLGPYSQESSHISTMLSYTLAGNPGIGIDMSQARNDYESYVRRLERRCSDLCTENQELGASAEKAKASHSRTQELNLRLGREVQQARRESAAATEHLRQYVEKAEKVAARSKRRHASRQQSTQTSSCGTMGHLEPMDAMDLIQQEDNGRFTAASQTGDANVDSGFACYPPGLESNDAVSRNIYPKEEDYVSACRCDESYGWGCSHHRSYGSLLLLAHRDLQVAIAHGPPGLEPPCDHVAKINSGDLGIRVAPVTALMKTCEWRRGEAHI